MASIFVPPRSMPMRTPHPSPRNLRDRVPGAGGRLLAERLLDECHEDRPLGVPDVGTEDFAALHGEDARPLELDRECELRRGPVAQERDDALRGGLEAKGSVRVRRE